MNRLMDYLSFAVFVLFAMLVFASVMFIAGRPIDFGAVFPPVLFVALVGKFFLDQYIKSRMLK